MKLCKNCGAQNADSRTFCIDCGKQLGKPLTGTEAEMAEAALDEAIERSYQNSDELRATNAEKIFGIIIALAFLGACAGYFLAPEKARVYFLMAAIPAPIVVITVFAGKLLWRWERWKLSFRYEIPKDEISVPTMHLVGRKLAIWGLGVLTLALLAFALMQMLPESPQTVYHIVDGQLVPIT